MTDLEQVYTFLKESNIYYISTVDKEGNPHVRPFTSYDLIDNKLYIQTSKLKKCFKEMINHPGIEISTFNKGRWIRLVAGLVHDDRVEKRKQVLDDIPSLRSMYDENDGKCAVLYLTNAKADIFSFTDEPIHLEF